MKGGGDLHQQKQNHKNDKKKRSVKRIEEGVSKEQKSK